MGLSLEGPPTGMGGVRPGIRTHESRERHRLSKLAPVGLRLTRLPVEDSRLPLHDGPADLRLLKT